MAGQSAQRPVVGITCDLVEASGGRLKADCGLAYAQQVSAAGGTPVLLPPIPALLESHLELCDAFVLTGGDDPRTEEFGAPTHPEAKPMHPQRQAYELALIRALKDRARAKPVLGVCLGMQLMSLIEGGRLEQHLPERIADAGRHRGEHAIVPVGSCRAVLLRPGAARSNHHQAVSDAGTLEVIAKSDDGLIEAVADPARPFYVGVQWHPERTLDHVLGAGLFSALVEAARG